MDEAPFPREIKLYLPTGSFLTATRLPGEMADDEFAHYRIQCRGQDHILRAFVNTIRDLKRPILLRMIDLEGENPIIKLHGFREFLEPRLGDGFSMYECHIAAIIIQSRALYGHGLVMEQRDWCDCSEATWCPSPFVECAGMSAYNPVEVTCASCIWALLNCTLTSKQLR